MSPSHSTSQAAHETIFIRHPHIFIWWPNVVWTWHWPGLSMMSILTYIAPLTSLEEPFGEVWVHSWGIPGQNAKQFPNLTPRFGWQLVYGALMGAKHTVTILEFSGGVLQLWPRTVPDIFWQALALHPIFKLNIHIFFRIAMMSSCFWRFQFFKVLKFLHSYFYSIFIFNFLVPSLGH